MKSRLTGKLPVFLSLILTLALLFALALPCAADESAPSEPAAAQETAAQETAAPEEADAETGADGEGGAAEGEAAAGETQVEEKTEKKAKSWFSTAFGKFAKIHWYTYVALGLFLVLGLFIARSKTMDKRLRIVAMILCFGFAAALAAFNLFTNLPEGVRVSPYVVTVIGLLAFMAVVMCFSKEKWNSRQIAFAAMSMAISFILSLIKLFRMPQGGSVTPASLLPLILFALAFGPRKGLIAGFAYGLLQLVESAEVVHPIQFLVDYPMAFGALALCCLSAAFTKEDSKLRLPLAVLLGYLGRFILAVISGAVFFSEYAGDQNAIVYSIVYNGTYLGVETAIAVVVSLIPGFDTLVRQIRRLRA